GDHRSEFAVSPANLSINGGQSATLEISCSPLAFGPRRATLNLPTNVPTSISDNTPKTFQYPLSCAGVGADYKASLPPGNIIAFHTTGSQPVSQSFEIWNDGNELLVVTFNGIYGEHPDDFAIQAPPEFISGGDPVITIPAGGARKVVTLTCHPQAVGERKAVLTFLSNGLGENKGIEYQLLCKNNASTPRYKSNPSSAATLTFGSSLVGESVTSSFKIQELGNDDLKVEFIGFEGEHASDFTLAEPTLFPLTIANDSGTEPEVQIQCTPSGTGQRTASLKLKSNDVDKPNPTYQLNCQGIFKGSIYQSAPAPGATFAIGSSPAGTAISKPLEIRNKGNAALNVTSAVIEGVHAGDFHLMNAPIPFTIPVDGEAKIVTIQCNPLGVGVRQAQLILTTDDQANTTVNYNLQCTGTMPPILGSIDFGDVVVGKSKSLPAQLKETGDAEVTIGLGVPPITEDQHDAFSILAPQFPILIPEGGDPELMTLQCSPSKPGMNKAVLILTSDNPAKPIRPYELMCKGIVAGPVFASTPEPNQSINFGSSLINVATQKILKIENKGDEALKVEIRPLDGAHKDDFEVINFNTKLEILPNTAAQEIQLQCKPSAMGERRAKLILSTNDNKNLTSTYELICLGNQKPTPGFDSTPVAPNGQLDFGSHAIGSIVQKTITIQEIGNDTLTIDIQPLDDNEIFSLVNTPTNLIINDGEPAKTINVQCIPQAA
ncbi:MAG: choice-of-anchor D domain-containing protein, partial [Pseudomonadota bacterium]|nr:choice-of-anchor D domain-containing protein [Pseudomonadota bacterium]